MKKTQNKTPLAIQLLSWPMRILLFIFVAGGVMLMYLGLQEQEYGISVLGLACFVFFSLPIYVKARPEAVVLAQERKDNPLPSVTTQSIADKIISEVKSTGFIILLLAAALIILFVLTQVIGFVAGLPVGTLLVIVILILLFKN